MAEIEDWNGRPIEVANSKLDGTGTWFVLDYADNLIRGSAPTWPPAAIAQKLYRSDRLGGADPSIQALAGKRLGFYCDLQSLHSEDGITWSYFGLLVTESQEVKSGFLNWLCARLGLPWTDNRVCEIDLWRRVAHPRTLVSGGPELDFFLYGDQCVIFGEAKWLSTEGVHGPGAGDTQMHYRRDYFRHFGQAIFGDRGRAVVGVALDQPVEKEVPAPVEGVETRGLYWTDLCESPDHPRAEEFARYYDWKQAHISSRFARRGRSRDP